MTKPRQLPLIETGPLFQAATPAAEPAPMPAKPEDSFPAYAPHIEKMIATRLVRRIINSGYSVSINDGEAFPVKRSRDLTTIFAAMASTDADGIVIRDAEGTKAGEILLIYGNGEDLISDHSDNELCARLVANLD